MSSSLTAASSASSASASPGGAGSAAAQTTWGAGQGYYIYINSKYAAATRDRIEDGIQTLITQGEPIKNISTDQESYRFAGAKVRTRLPEYPCGTIIPPDFFAPDKLANTINIIILYVVSTPAQTAVSAATRSGTAPLVAQGFAILRDLNLATKMAAASATYGGPSLKKQQGNYLYIEGVCASKHAGRGVGTAIMELVHKLAYNSHFAGTKLASLAYVIPYYFNKFAYRFRKGCQAEVSSSGGGDDSNVAGSRGNPKLEYHDLNVMVRTLISRTTEDEARYTTEWRNALDALSARGFNANISTEQHKTLASLRKNVGIWWESDEGSRYLDAWERLGMQDQGFYMYFCFKNNPTYGVASDNPRQTPFTIERINAYRTTQGRTARRTAATGVAEAAKAAVTGGAEWGGGRKRKKSKKRKKTKKKALKKRHHRRRRKTRRHRRKRRRKHRRRKTKRHHRRKTRRHRRR